jgi:hypothetical protein
VNNKKQHSEKNATTAASLFGVFKEAVSDDDSGFIDL